MIARRMWHGPAIWGAATVGDIALVTTTSWWQAPDGPAGFLSLAGFGLGILWAQTGETIETRRARERDTASRAES